MYASLTLKTTSKVDLSGPLSKYGKNKLSMGSYKDLKQLIPVIEDSRKSVLAIKEYVNDDTITTMNTYLSYTRQIVGAFPVMEEKPVGIYVKWTDINGKNSVSTYNFGYETACILFNLAVLHTQAALPYTIDTPTLERVQQSVNYYKESASCFAYLRRNLSASYAQVSMSWDMTENALLGFENYVHAMEQVAVASKADLSGTKSYGKASIMFGCQKMFKEAAGAFGQCGSNATSLMQRCSILAQICEIRAKIYLVNHSEENMDSGNNCGLALGLITSCRRIIDDIRNNYGKTITKGLDMILIDTADKLKTMYSADMRQNRLYLQMEVKESEFQIVEGKIIHVLSDPNLLNVTEDAFKSMLSTSVMDALNRYHEYVEIELSKRISEIDSFDQDLINQKESLHVEATLNAIHDRSGLPEEMWNSITDIQSTQGVVGLEKLSNDLKRQAKTVQEKLDRLIKEIHNEMTQMPSSPQATFLAERMNTILQDVMKFIATMKQAEEGNKRIDDAIVIVMKSKDYLNGTRDQIEKQLPKIQFSGQMSMLIEQVREAINDINRLISDRKMKIEEISLLAKDDIIVRDELIRDGSSADERGVFIRGFSPIEEKLRQLTLSTNVQDGYVNKLQTRLDAFNKAKENDSALTERHEIFENISLAIRQYYDAIRFIKEGVSFYGQLDTIATQLINTFETHRNELKRLRASQQPPSPSQYQQPPPSSQYQPSQYQQSPSQYQQPPPPSQYQQPPPPSQYQQPPPPQQYQQSPSPQQYQQPPPPQQYQQSPSPSQYQQPPPPQQYQQPPLPPPPQQYQQSPLPSQYQQPPQQYQPQQYGYQQPPSQGYVPPPSQNGKNCRYCGSLNQGNMRNCITCGKLF